MNNNYFEIRKWYVAMLPKDNNQRNAGANRDLFTVPLCTALIDSGMIAQLLMLDIFILHFLSIALIFHCNHEQVIYY